jgi:hypothetical protein
MNDIEEGLKQKLSKARNHSLKNTSDAFSGESRNK